MRGRIQAKPVQRREGDGVAPEFQVFGATAIHRRGWSIVTPRVDMAGFMCELRLQFRDIQQLQDRFGHEDDPARIKADFYLRSLDYQNLVCRIATCSAKESLQPATFCRAEASKRVRLPWRGKLPKIRALSSGAIGFGRLLSSHSTKAAGSIASNSCGEVKKPLSAGALLAIDTTTTCHAKTDEDRRKSRNLRSVSTRLEERGGICRMSRQCRRLMWESFESQ